MRKCQKNYPSIHEIKNMQIVLKNLAYAEIDYTWNRQQAPFKTNVFYLILDGAADIWCNNQLYHMVPGNIYVIPAGTNESHFCHDFCKKIFFYADLYTSNRTLIPLAPPGCIVLKNRKNFIEKMHDLQAKTDYCSSFTLRIMMEQLMLEVLEQNSEEMPIINYSPLINKSIYLISKKPHMSHSAVTLAKRLHTTPHHLRKLFAKELNLTITQYVTQKVLEAAEKELLQSSLSIKEVSTKYGFCDQYYFSKLFKAHFGISPSKYRKKQII